jgi:hypothetical protein
MLVKGFYKAYQVCATYKALVAGSRNEDGLEIVEPNRLSAIRIIIADQHGEVKPTGSPAVRGGRNGVKLSSWGWGWGRGGDEVRWGRGGKGLTLRKGGRGGKQK